MLPHLPHRSPEAHKGDFGRILIVAGSRGMMGAAILASQSSLRSGAGLSVLVVPDTLVPVASSLQVCAVVRGVEDTGGGAHSANAAQEILKMEGDVVVIGPGLGGDPRTRMAVQELVASERRPLVLDADALNAFAEEDTPLTRPGFPRLLTPHPGEMARLLRKSVGEIQSARVQSAQEAAKRFHSVCVLKGHRSVVTDGTQTYVNETGNPGMATGGSGDVLTGVIGALLAQKLSPYDAACLGTHLHGLAGDFAARAKGQISLIATDLIDCLPDAFHTLESP